MLSLESSVIRQAGRIFGVAALICATAGAQQIPTAAQAEKGRAGAAAPAFREVTDEADRKVRLPLEVRRIVSLAPNLTETVYALGADERLVGVTDYCDYPPEAQKKAKVGGAVTPSIEHIVALKPDLVLAQANGMNRRETVEALENLGLAVYVTNSRTVQGVLESTQHVAEAIGAVERAEILLADLRARLAEVQRRLEGRPPKRVVFVVWHEPLISVGRQTFLADALRAGGAESVIETSQDWPQVNLEELLKLQPEFLVFASSHSETVTRTVDSLRGERGWRALEAIQKNRVAVISDAVNRPGPRLVEAIEQLARQLHPEAFAEKSQDGKGKMIDGNAPAISMAAAYTVFRFPISGATRMVSQ